MEYTSEQLFNMSDEELNKAVVEERAKESINSEEPIENNSTVEVEEDNNKSNESETIPEQSETYKIKADGVEYDFTLDELKTVASKGMNYTRKMQELKPYRQTISAMSENNITHEDINLLIDIKKGNKDALATLIKQHNTDVFELPEEPNYTPTNYGKSESFQSFESAVETMALDSEFTRTRGVYERLDKDSKEFFYHNPQALQGLHQDIKDGIFDKVMPVANKLAIMDEYRKPVIEYYLKAGEQLYKEQANNVPNENLNEVKKSAGLPKNIKTGSAKVTDYLAEEEDDEAYYEWYKKLQQRY